jgi:high affinity cGMP-specific 3',5'-cyclic phosphodiesterase 9
MNLQIHLEPLDVLSLLISALCHDLDHDGFNNSYQINALTPLAILYNDKSPLEMYHCAVAFSILANEKCNIISNLSREQFKRLRENVIE